MSVTIDKSIRYPENIDMGFVYRYIV